MIKTNILYNLVLPYTYDFTSNVSGKVSASTIFNPSFIIILVVTFKSDCSELGFSAVSHNYTVFTLFN